jgi:hypothetical protein
MRTTLTLDDDVAMELESVQRIRKTSFKKLVNEVLRKGLLEMNQKPRPKKKFRTKTVSLGRCLVGSIDDVAGVLSVVEGDRLK